MQPLTKTIALTEFRANLTAVLAENVRREGEHVIIARNGEPYAVVLDIDEYEDLLELRDPTVQEMIRVSRDELRAGKTYPAGKLMGELQRVARRAVSPAGSRARRSRPKA
jgi:prevent-host-death family protein